VRSRGSAVLAVACAKPPVPRVGNKQSWTQLLHARRRAALVSDLTCNVCVRGQPLTWFKRWCLDRLRGDDNTQPPTYSLTAQPPAASNDATPTAATSRPPASTPTPSIPDATSAQRAQPGWVDDRFGAAGGPLRFNSIFTRLFQPFMGLIFYAQVRLSKAVPAA